MTLTIPPEEVQAAVERVIEARKPEFAEDLSELEMRKPRNKAEAAAFLGITPRQLEVWMRKSGNKDGLGVPYYKPAKLVRFTYAALSEWLEKFRVN